MQNNKFTLVLSLFFSLQVLILSGCSNNASHLPSPAQIPGAIIGSTIENSTYNAKRRKVEAYVAEHYLSIRQDVQQGGGEFLEGALDSAGIKGNRRGRAKELIMNDQGQRVHFANEQLVADNLINVFVVLYGVKRIDKKIKGHTRSEAYKIIMDYAEDNFESLRIAVQQGQGDGLKGLESQLNITERSKRNLFNKRAKALYKTIYLEPVVVWLMISR